MIPTDFPWQVTMTKNELRYVSGSFHDKVLVITILVEEFRNPNITYAMRDEILSLVDPAKMSHVVLDFQNVKFVGSLGLLAFVAVRRHFAGGQILICNFSDLVRGVFETCHLISSTPSVVTPFWVEDTLEAALARCSG